MRNSFSVKVNKLSFSKNNFNSEFNKTRLSTFTNKTKYNQRVKNAESELRSLSQEIVRNIKVNQLSGQKLKRRTGKLQDSIKYKLFNTNSVLTSSIYTTSQLAKLYENGGSGISIIRAHTELRTKVFNRVVPPYLRKVPVQSRKWNFKALHFIRDEVSRIKPKILNRVINCITK